MPGFNAATLISAWEDGISQPLTARALTLLSRTCVENPRTGWARAAIGERDARLLRLHEELFGSRLDAVADCPQCMERLELSFATQDIEVPADQPSADTEDLRIEAGGYEVRFRVPNSEDILAAAGSADEAGLLLARCIRQATRDGEAVECAELPDVVVGAVTGRMSQADPQADVRVALSCPACGHVWSMPFDIVSYLWGEFEDEAQRLLLEVHTLASSYGWSERDILAMSACRRRLYLDMLGA